MYKIYLAGYISGKKMEECTAWRKRLRMEYQAHSWPIIWLDPLNGKKLETIDEEGLESHIPGKALVHRDYKCVSEADLIIANMNTFGCARPSIGTTYELAWAWFLRKPVIMITEDLSYINHPFTKDTYSVVVKDMEELLEKKLINYFFKGSVNAAY
jgi:hypothetical protein